MTSVLAVVASGLTIALFPAQVEAQAVWGRATAGLATYSNCCTSGMLVDASGGVEVRAPGGWGVAGGVGFLTGDGLVRTLSVDGVLHANPRGQERRQSPFVAAGYTSLGGRHAWHVRGGVDYWRSRQHALTVEAQWTARRDFPTRILSIRLGVTFR